MNGDMITAIDIGTNKIFGISGILRDTGLEVLGTEVQNLPEDVLKKGRIADLEEASNYIFEIIKSLKVQTGERIEWVYIGIGGGHLRGEIYSKKLEIEPPGREISKTDIQILQKDIKNSVVTASGPGKKVLFSVPQEYIIDEQNITSKSPEGMHGNVVETRVHIITSDINPVQDIINCIENAGAKVERIFPHSWAASEATLTEEERKLGCLLIDMGKGTTDIALFSEGKILFTDSIKVGGSNIDKDLSIGLHTPVVYAEDLKKKHGWCNYKTLAEAKHPSLSEKVEIFSASGKMTHQATNEQISKIVYERVREILDDLIKYRLERITLLYKSGAGVVLSGGCAKLKGLNNLAETVFELPARTGIPKNLLNMDKSFQQPEFTCGIGLLMLASKNEGRDKKANLREKAIGIFRRFF